MPKLTQAQIREFVRRKFHEEMTPLVRPKTEPGTVPPPYSMQGKMISGADLQRAAPFIMAIPDQVASNKIKSMFSMHPKYQVLNMLLDERGEFAREHEAGVFEIAAAAIENDYQVVTTLQKERW